MTNDGGPAFPRSGVGIGVNPATQESYEYNAEEQQGMSLRDYFAGRAMTKIMDAAATVTENSTKDMLTTEAYRWADSMLRSREE